MTLHARIELRLREAFSPTLLEVINESHRHAGHNPEAAATGQTHFRIRIAADQLAGLSRVAAHRAVNEALAFAVQEGLHALAIEIVKPQG
jgi:BolA protein